MNYIDSEKVYNVDELAKIFLVSRNLIIREIEAGKLKSFKVGTLYRICGNHVIEYMNSQMLGVK